MSEYYESLGSSEKARCPGLYTFEQLLSWKQIKGYNYFQSKYVRTVYRPLKWLIGETVTYIQKVPHLLASPT